MSAWPDPSALIRALGAEVVKQRAATGDGEAQFSQGCRLVSASDGNGSLKGASGRSPKADVGLALVTALQSFPVAHQTEARRCGHLMTKCSICGCRPCAQEGVELLEKAAGQGHAYAMDALADMHYNREEHEQAVKWATKGAEAGLPKAMYNLGISLDKGEGVPAPDYPAAADWYRRAADAGVGEAAVNLCHMYSVGRGWA